MPLAKLATLLSSCALAVSARADFQVWSDVGASAEVAKRVGLGFDQELRLGNGASRVERVRPEGYLSWRATKWLSLKLAYRYKLEYHYTKGEDYADGWHEGYVDATLRHRIDRMRDLRVSLRLRLQHERGRPWVEDGDLVTSSAARQRLEIELQVWRKAVGVFGSWELFEDLADGSPYKWRASVGTSARKGSHELAIRYLLEHPLTEGDEPVHVLGLTYQFAYELAR